MQSSVANSSQMLFGQKNAKNSAAGKQIRHHKLFSYKEAGFIALQRFLTHNDKKKVRQLNGFNSKSL
jgi:hypothetical protein